MAISYWIMYLLPEIATVLAIFITIAYGLWRDQSRDYLVLIGLTLCLSYTSESHLIANQLYIADAFSWFSKLIITCLTAIVLWISGPIFRPRELLKFEYNVLILFAMLGAFVMVSAHDLLTLFIGLELQALSLYVLTGMCRDQLISTEAAIKYFVLGALSSGIFLYGCSLIYGYAGTTNFALLQKLFTQYDTLPVAPVIGFVFIFVAFAFKLALVPFHAWLPDVYQGTPGVVTAFLATVPKFAAIMAFIRLLMQPFSSFFHYWQIMIAGLIVASVIIGALGALMQQHLRRLLAYSSIGHIGFVCLGFMAGEASAIISIVLYMIIYMITLVGIFATLLQLHARGHGIELMEDLAGLNHSYPYHAFILATLLFSLAGIPPLAGFWVKFYILQSAVAAGWYGLSITVVLAGVVSAFYYLRLIKVMYFDGAVDTSLNVSGQLSNKVIMTLSAVTSLGFAILLGGSVTWVTPAIQSIATGW